MGSFVCSYFDIRPSGHISRLVQENPCAEAMLLLSSPPHSSPVFCGGEFFLCRNIEISGAVIPMKSWNEMNSVARHPALMIGRDTIPSLPGVYAWYRGGVPVYVGKATGRQGLRQRVWRNHLARGRGAIAGSAFRRNIAETLGFGSAKAIKQNPALLSDEQVREINTWVAGCELAWHPVGTTAAALALEAALKSERLPSLTKR